MPPRYAYWTILIDNQPTAFRATKVEELLPTFKQLKAKNPSAVMMWSQFGKLWNSPDEAMAAGKSKDPRQSARPKPYSPRPKPQAPSPKPYSDRDRPKLEWKPKGTFKPTERGHSKPQEGRDRPKLEWKPKGSFTPAPRTHPKPFAQASRPKPQDGRDRPKLEWKPKGSFTPQAPSPKPQDGQDRPKPSRPRRVPPKPGSKNWRPGGDHQDPRQKYIDAKKAKWTRFKKAIRDRHDKKNKP